MIYYYLEKPAAEGGSLMSVVREETAADADAE